MTDIDKIVSALSEWLMKVLSSALPKVQVSPTSGIGRVMSGFFGIAPEKYNVWEELVFLAKPTIERFVAPSLHRYLSALPESELRTAANAYADALVAQAKEKGHINLFGVKLGANAFEGLKELLNEKLNEPC